MFGVLSRKQSVRPVARTEGLSATTSGDETLVYDRERFVIRRLDADTARVWRLADGTRTLAMLADDAHLSAKSVEASLAKLAAWDLALVDSLGKSFVTRRRLIGSAAGAVAAGTFIARAAASCANAGSPCQFQITGGGSIATGEIDCSYGGLCCGTVGGSKWVAGYYDCGTPL